MSGEIKVQLIGRDGTVREVSEAFAEIRNLVAVAEAHVLAGCGADCEVSVTELRRTAQRIRLFFAPVSEWSELDEMISGMPF